MRLVKTLTSWLVCVVFFTIFAAVLVEEKAGLTDIILSSGFAILFWFRLYDDMNEYSSDIPSLKENTLGFIKGICFWIFATVMGCVPIIGIKPPLAEYYIYLTMILLMLNIILSMIPEKKSKVKK